MHCRRLGEEGNGVAMSEGGMTQRVIESGERRREEGMTGTKMRQRKWKKKKKKKTKKRRKKKKMTMMKKKKKKKKKRRRKKKMTTTTQQMMMAAITKTPRHLRLPHSRGGAPHLERDATLWAQRPETALDAVRIGRCGHAKDRAEKRHPNRHSPTAKGVSDVNA